MFLAGSLKAGGTSTVGQTDQPGELTENSTLTRMDDSFIHPESPNSHTSFLSDDENDTLERAEIRTAALVIRSPPRNVPELARLDTIHHMSGPEERARARSRSGSRMRKWPDYSPPLVPPMPVDVSERLGDSLGLPSKGTSIVEGQLAAIHTRFNPTENPPWQSLRLHPPPPRDEMRSPLTPPSIPLSLNSHQYLSRALWWSTCRFKGQTRNLPPLRNTALRQNLLLSLSVLARIRK